MAIIVFITSSIIVVLLDAILWRNLTPNIIAIIPTFFVVLFATYISPYIGFVVPASEIYLILSLFYLTSGLFSISIAILFNKIISENDTLYKFNVSRVNIILLKLFILFGCLFISYMIYEAYLEVGNIHEELFTKLISLGISGHVYIFCMISAPILFFLKNKKDWISLLIVMLAFALLFIKQVKSWIIIPYLFLFFMFYYSGRINHRFRSIFTKIILITLVSTTIFFAVYFLNHLSSANYIVNYDLFQNSLKSISIHFISYLVSGVLGFSELIQKKEIFTGIDYHYLFNTLDNIISIINDKPVQTAVVYDFYTINEEYVKSSNVFTIWGTLLFRAGWWSFLIYSLIISFLNILLALSNKSKIIFFIYCYLVSFLGVAWFEYYYYHIAVYEGIIWIIIVYCILKDRNEKFKYQNKN